MILSVLMIIAFILLLVRSLSQSKRLADIWQWIDPFLAISTVIFAIFIWYNEKKQDWENTLPKKLDVYFCLKDEIFYEIKNAPLAGAGDICQWGQQIGRQMNQGDLERIPDSQSASLNSKLGGR